MANLYFYLQKNNYYNRTIKIITDYAGEIADSDFSMGNINFKPGNFINTK